MSKWMLRQSSANIADLARQTGLDAVLARLLAVRGYTTPDQVNAFLHADQVEFADALLFADMQAAVDRVIQAYHRQERCAIYGDYDADGVMSTVILLKTLHALGLPVQFYIPERENEGYGMNNEAIAQLAEQGVQLIIACDNGISAIEQAVFAAELGIDLVIIDHHTVTVEQQAGKSVQILPKACAVVDGKRIDCPYPFKAYCAAAMCYRFSEVLYQALGLDWQALSQELLVFATIASICDVVDLTGENRTLVSRGLKMLKKTEILGLLKLLEAVELSPDQVNVYHVGFILGPCINACGRLESADLGVRLFMTTDLTEAEQLAQRMVELNRQRRQMTEDGLRDAEAMIAQEKLDQDKIIVLHSPTISQSVAGIIAGRLKEKYFRPAIVFGGDGEELRGSGRSLDGYDLFQGLTEVKSALTGFGGHTLAAGLAIKKERLQEFRYLINASCKQSMDEYAPIFRIDCPLAITHVTLRLAKALQAFSPVGKGNEVPLFADKNLSLVKLSLLGKNGSVLRWHLRHASGYLCEAIDFHGKEKLETYICDTFGHMCWEQLISSGSSRCIEVDILYHLAVNLYNGRENVQLQIVDFRPASGR